MILIKHNKKRRMMTPPFLFRYIRNIVQLNYLIAQHEHRFILVSLDFAQQQAEPCLVT